MWNTALEPTHQMSHDMPCPRCGHGIHVYLGCGDGCSCPPAELPGSAAA